MKKILIITLTILFLSIGVLMLISSRNELDILIFIALKICGMFFIGLSFYIMYEFKNLLQ